MTDSVDHHYALAGTALAGFARTVEHTSRSYPGTKLRDPDWLGRRVDDTRGRWGHDDPRVAGTLWWYAASSTLVAAPLAMLLTTGRAPDPDLGSLTVSLRANGYLEAVRSRSLLDSVSRFRCALLEAHVEVIEPLAQVSGAAPRALWAIATDSVAGRSLDVARELGTPAAGSDLARELCAPPLLPPRFVDVSGTRSTRRFVRRSSCCLVYIATGREKCASCPRRTRESRAAELESRADT